MGLINNTVYLENNYELWKNMFEEEKEKLIKIFNQDNFEIEHVGSTSIKGLSAKPIVDIAIGVNSFSDMDKYIDILKEIYNIKINDIDNEMLLIKENDVETFFLIHVLPLTCERYINMIKFRDILINNPNTLKEYEKLKINLSKKYPNDRKMYTQTKRDFIEEILKNTN